MGNCCCSSTPPSPVWSDLPQDLLARIARSLTSPSDLDHFGAVCKSWRGAAAAATSLPLPCLAFIPARVEPTTMRFHGLSNRELLRVGLPCDLWSWHCWGSSHGWLAMVESLVCPFLFNPVSGDRVDLPHFRTLPKLFYEAIWVDIWEMPFHVDGTEQTRRLAMKLVMSAPPGDPTCVAMATYPLSHKLAYARPGDTSWTPLPSSHWSSSVTFDYLTCLHGTFCGLHDGFVSVFTNTPRDGFRWVRVDPELKAADSEGIGRCTRYLVAIPGGIAILHRYREEEPHDAHSDRTTGFQVLLLEGCLSERGRRLNTRSKCRVREVKSIGECSLLVWHNHAVCIPTSTNVSGVYMPNCIYFTQYAGGKGDYHLSVFHVEKGTFRRCTTLEGAATSPVWITPRLKSSSI